MAKDFEVDPIDPIKESAVDYFENGEWVQCCPPDVTGGACISYNC